MRTLAGYQVPEEQNELDFTYGKTFDQPYNRLRELLLPTERGLSPQFKMLAAQLDYAQNTAEVVATVYLIIKHLRSLS
jgi:hypothetical protein